MRGLCVAMVVLAGCGRIGFDPQVSGGGGDAGGDDAGGDGSDAPGARAPFELALTQLSGITGLATLPDGGLVFVGAVLAPITLGGMVLPGPGNGDVLIGVLEPDGSLRWAKVVGGAQPDLAMAVAVGSDGSFYVTGSVGATADFGGGARGTQLTDAFVASYTSGGAHRWSVTFGGPDVDIAPFGSDQGYSIAVLDNVVVVSGQVRGPVDFGNGVITPASGATHEAFVASFSTVDGANSWGRRWGSSSVTTAHAVTIDSAHQIYAAGRYKASTSFGGAVRPYRGGDNDAFVVAVTATGSYRWDRTFGSTGTDRIQGLTTIGTTIVATGFFDGASDFPGLAPPVNQRDGFAVTYSTSGTPGWSLAVNGGPCDVLAHVTEHGGELVVTGGYTGTVVLPDGPHPSAGGIDALVLRVTGSGSLISGITFGGPGDDLVSATDGVDVYAGAYDIGFDCMQNTYTGGNGFIRRP